MHTFITNHFIKFLTRRLENVVTQEHGSILVYGSLVMTVLISVAAMAIDGSNGFLQRRRMQNAADAAALAGARMLAQNASAGKLDTEIRYFATQNGADMVTWNYTNDGRAIDVNVSYTFGTYFAPIIGFDYLTADASSEAGYEPIVSMDRLSPLSFPCDCVDLGEQTYVGTPDDQTFTQPGPQSTRIRLNDNKNTTYDVEFVSSIDDVWTYRVTEIAGRDLSHWTLGIDSCLNLINWSSPSGAEIGRDGSTGMVGIKWNVGDGFHSSTFSFRVNGNYQVGEVEVLAKGGPNFTTEEIYGPICGGGGVVVGGGGGTSDECHFTFLDWNGSGSSSSELSSDISDPSRSGIVSINDTISRINQPDESLAVTNALNQWVDVPVTVPLHYSDNNSEEAQICSFADFTLRTYDFWGDNNEISGEFSPTVVDGVASDPNAPDFGAREVVFGQGNNGATVVY